MAGALCTGPTAAEACTIIFTRESEARALRTADLVVTAEARWQHFDPPPPGSALKRGTAAATVIDVFKGRTRPGAEVTYAVVTGDDGLCPALWSTEPRRLYKLYLKRSKSGGAMEIIHREPHFGP
jgi:hypothetical protein